MPNKGVVANIPCSNLSHFFIIYFHIKSTKYCFKNRTRNRARRAPILPTISLVPDDRLVTLVFYYTRYGLSKAYSKPVLYSHHFIFLVTYKLAK